MFDLWQLVDFDLLVPQVFDIWASLVFHQEQETLPAAASPRRAPNPMHEGVTPLGRVKLHNPVHFGNVDSSGCQIGGQQEGETLLLLLLELVVNLGPLPLINLPVQFHC